MSKEFMPEQVKDNQMVLSKKEEDQEIVLDNKAENEGEDKQLTLDKKEKDDEFGGIAEGDKFGVVESSNKEVVLDKTEREIAVKKDDDKEASDNKDDDKEASDNKDEEDRKKAERDKKDEERNQNSERDKNKDKDEDTKEDKESAREIMKIREEYELLKKEIKEVDKKVFEPHTISMLDWTEEFIKEFGAEKFADAIEEIKKSDKPKNMHEVVKILETDKGKRQELYEKIINKDETSFENSKDIELRKDIKRRIEKIEFLKYLNSLDGLPERVLLKIQQILGGESKISGEFSFVSLFSFKDLGADFKERLIKCNGDIEKLATDSHCNNSEKRIELRTKQQELADELYREIEQINIKLKTEYLKKNKDLLKKLEIACANKPIVKGGKEIADAQIFSVEKALEENYKNVEKEIDKLTREQRELIDEIEKVHI